MAASRPLIRVLPIAALLLVCGLTESVAAGDIAPRPARKGTRHNVVIDSAPQQAAIYLDKKEYGVVGYTPYKGRLVRGKYILTLQRDGFVAKTLEIEVSRSQRKFFAVLEREVLPATVAISAAADRNLVGGYVHVDGKYVGKVPIETKVPAGRHQVIIQRKGYKHFSQWVELKPGERLQLAPALKRLSAPPGSLLVDASVAGAEVWINGKKHPDGTPTVVEGLSPGMHAVEVRAGKKGAETLAWKHLVEVKSGQRVKIRAAAPPKLVVKAPAPTPPATKAPPKPVGVGTVRIFSSVANAQVSLDGKVMGISPAALKRGLDIKFVPAGLHQVSAKTGDGRLASAKVTVVKDKMVEVALTPVASAPVKPTPAAPPATTPAPTTPAPAAPVSGPRGRLKVTANVEGANVKVDGKSVGTAPLEMDLPVGEHQVLVAAPGTTPVAQGARIAKGMLTTINAKLTKGLPNSPMVGQGRDDEHQPVAPKPAAPKASQLTGSQPPVQPWHPEKMMRSTRGGRVLAKGALNLDLAAGYPYYLNMRAVVGIDNTREAGLDALLAYRSALHFHEVLVGSRYRFLGDGPLQTGAFVAVGGGANSGGRDSFTLQTGLAVTLVFGDRVALNGRLEVDIWSDQLCGELVEPVDTTADTPKGCQVDKDGEAINPEAAALTSGGADKRDNGVRLLGGVALEIAISNTTNIFAALDKRLLGNEKRAGFSSSFNSFMTLGDDPGWQASAGMSFGF